MSDQAHAGQPTAGFTHSHTCHTFHTNIYIPSKVQYIKSDVETRKTSIIHCLVFGAKMEQFDFEFDFEHDLSADVGQPAEAPQSMPPSARKNYRQVRSEWGLVA